MSFRVTPPPTVWCGTCGRRVEASLWPGHLRFHERQAAHEAQTRRERIIANASLEVRQALFTVDGILYEFQRVD